MDMPECRQQTSSRVAQLAGSTPNERSVTATWLRIYTSSIRASCFSRRELPPALRLLKMLGQRLRHLNQKACR